MFRPTLRPSSGYFVLALWETTSGSILRCRPKHVVFLKNKQDLVVFDLHYTKLILCYSHNRDAKTKDYQRVGEITIVGGAINKGKDTHLNRSDFRNVSRN